MNNLTVTFKFRLVPSYEPKKISAIRVWRQVTGAGLKDCKDFIELAADTSAYALIPVRLTAAQFGLLMVELYNDIELHGYTWQVANPQVERNLPQDFTYCS